MRFPPGTFLELDDLAGGRKVAMVCKDGVTFWDLMNAELVTPLVIHPIMNPVELGSAVGFAEANKMQDAFKALIAFLRSNNDQRVDEDPLFVMRVLWCLKQHGDGAFDDQALALACEQAQGQANAVARLHEHTKQYSAA
jgi:hypothetical protein